MRTLHFISHTHWDREWHEPFQVFRLRLGESVDKALDLLAADPEYKYYMLDGQTIVLEDYAEFHPEREAELRARIREGRVLVGPWYVLPDEFLVSGEAIIRNLQRGMRIAGTWGSSMHVGYIPDPFGHISQIPQLLAGFGIGAAMFRRGLADEPTELLWEGADGTQILTTYLRDGYDNAAWLGQDPEQFTAGVAALVQSLAPYAVTEHMLMMHGTDHMQPWAGVPALMRQAEAGLPGVRIVHSNLEEYVDAVRGGLSENEMKNLCVVKGELRNPKRHHLLPGVASTRMWIKQRNAREQTLLEKWAEPLAAISEGLSGPASARRPNLRRALRLAWKYLLQNHPHDSICGCSVDQVHAEMAPRFDWVEQIGGQIVEQSLEAIAGAIDTRQPRSLPGAAVVVLNPVAGPRSDAVDLQVDLAPGVNEFKIVDENGRDLAFVERVRRRDDLLDVTAPAEDLRRMFGGAASGKLDGMNIQSFEFRVDGECVEVDLAVSGQGEIDPDMLQSGMTQFSQLMANPEIRTFHARVHSRVRVDLTVLARGVPGYGYKTFWLIPASEQDLSTLYPRSHSPHGAKGEGGGAGDSDTNSPGASEKRRDAATTLDGSVVENEYLRLEVEPRDGTLTVVDKASGTVFSGLNRFVDGGDRGDLYNYTPPEEDLLVDAPSEPPDIRVLESNRLRQVFLIRSLYRVPAALASDRGARSVECVTVHIATYVTLNSGARRIDFKTEIENTAQDHRLRVEFPTALPADMSLAAQAFDIVEREVALPAFDEEWIERPRPEKPMQEWVAIKDDRAGALLAARGLPEYEARRDRDGVTLALTLLRCVGWLSRPDLINRRGDAGPELPTPGAQEFGSHVFEYSFVPFSNGGAPGGLDWNGARAEGVAFAAPMKAIATDAHDGPLPPAGRWVLVTHPDFVLTAIKPPEEGGGLIVRGYSTGSDRIKVKLAPSRAFTRASRVSLNEEFVESLGLDESGAVEFDADRRQIISLRFE